MKPSGLAVVMAALQFATAAFAEGSPPLPETLKGAGTYSGTRRGVVNPVVLSQIKQDGDKVTGIISDYRFVNGQCEADNTLFAGTYVDGVLAVKSARLVSRKSDGAPCGAMNIEATYGNGSLTGAYWFGNSARTTVEFPLK